MKAAVQWGLRRTRNTLAEMLRRSPITSEWAGPPKDEDTSFAAFLARGSAGAERSTEREIFPSRPVALPAAKTFGPAPGLDLGPEAYASVPVSVFACPDARVFNRPPAIIGPDDHLFAFASCWHSAELRSHFAFHQLRLGKLRRLAGNTLYLGGNSNLWHFYGDTLRQVALLGAAGRDLADFDFVIVKRPTSLVERHFYPLLGLSEARVVDAEAFQHVKCDRLTFFPSGSNRRGPDEVQALRSFLFATLRLGVAPEIKRRIYVSRAAADFRRVANEGEIVARLQRRGFECLRLETMTIGDQARAFRDAEMVVAPHGAGLANLLFCTPGARIVELRNPAFRPANAASETYRVVSGLLDLPYFTVLARATYGSPNPHYADLTFAPEDIAAAVDAAERTR